MNIFVVVFVFPFRRFLICAVLRYFDFSDSFFSVSLSEERMTGNGEREGGINFRSHEGTRNEVDFENILKFEEVVDWIFREKENDSRSSGQ